MRKETPSIEPDKIFSRREYQEILLARMAGGDLYANEERLRIRQVDVLFDRVRVKCGEKPIYGPARETSSTTPDTDASAVS